MGTTRLAARVRVPASSDASGHSSLQLDATARIVKTESTPKRVLVVLHPAFQRTDP